MIRAFLLGLREGFTDPNSVVGMTYDNDPNSNRSRAYDHGLTIGQQLRGSLR